MTKAAQRQASLPSSKSDEVLNRSASTSGSKSPLRGENVKTLKSSSSFKWFDVADKNYTFAGVYC